MYMTVSKFRETTSYQRCIICFDYLSIWTLRINPFWLHFIGIQVSSICHCLVVCTLMYKWILRMAQSLLAWIGTDVYARQTNCSIVNPDSWFQWVYGPRRSNNLPVATREPRWHAKSCRKSSLCGGLLKYQQKQLRQLPLARLETCKRRRVVPATMNEHEIDLGFHDDDDALDLDAQHICRRDGVMGKESLKRRAAAFMMKNHLFVLGISCCVRERQTSAPGLCISRGKTYYCIVRKRIEQTLCMTISNVVEALKP